MWSKSRQRALLLYLAGPEVEKIFATLPDTGEDNDYDTAEVKLTTYFSPKKNVLFERYVFRQACQEQNETIDQYHTCLHHLSATCDFKDADEERGREKYPRHCELSHGSQRPPPTAPQTKEPNLLQMWWILSP